MTDTVKIDSIVIDTTRDPEGHPRFKPVKRGSAAENLERYRLYVKAIRTYNRKKPLNMELIIEDLMNSVGILYRDLAERKD